MADSNRVSLTADGKKVSADSDDAAFTYDAADADRAADLLKTSAESKDTNERAVRGGLTEFRDGVRVRTDAGSGLPASDAAADDGTAKPKR